MKTVFEYIPVIGGTTAKLKVVSISGVSTAHMNTRTDRGRLYGKLTKPSSDYVLQLYSDIAMSNLVLQGSTSALNSYFDLAEQNSSGLDGRAYVESYDSDDTSLILIVSFAVDVDVMVSEAICAKLPSYDSTYGLGYFHAIAMREILTSCLPAALPNLFGGHGLAAFVPNRKGIELPDLTKLVNPDQLRVAQADLVKALAAREAEHTAEWHDVMMSSYARFEEAMKRVAIINTDEDEAKAQQEADSRPGTSFGSWSRG